MGHFKPSLALFALTGAIAARAGESAGYVDAKLCATCHRQIAESYAKTGMGRSVFRPTPANAIEDYRKADFTHTLSDTSYSMISRDGAYYQRRWQIGFGGRETNVEELKIDYVMGSGNHARSYLHRTPRGTLIELPLGWYSDKGGIWAMVPGADTDRPQTRRFVSYKCMFCHNAYPQIPAGNEAPGSDPVFSGDLPQGIDCQRCHGPGGKHVRAVQTAGTKPEDIRASIVNPARLSSKLQMDLCMQCHLETTSGRIPALLERFNRGPFSYLPGEPLEDFAISFDHAQGTGHDDKFEAVSSAYRLRRSQCFLKSEGRLTCGTCHDPHRVPRGLEAIGRYSGICRQCHTTLATTHPASDNCISCHMPKRRADDAPHVIMTDHLIVRRPAARDLLAEFPERSPEYHGEVVPYYPSPLPPTNENRLYKAVAQVGLGNNSEPGLPELAAAMERLRPPDAEFYMVLGGGWQRIGNLPEAAAAYQEALRLKPDSARELRALASAQPARAGEILKRATDIAPSDPEAWYRYGLLDLAAGHASDAVLKIEKAIALDPSLPAQSRSLAEALMKNGQADRAQSALKDALRTDPFDADAWDLEGRLLAEKGELPEAAYDFEKSIRLQPGNAPHLYDYALALVRANRFQDAEDRARLAVLSDPALAEAHQLLGGLLLKKGDLQGARQQMEEATRARQALERLAPQ